MYNPQLSRREFLRGTGGTVGTVQAAGLYDRAIAAAGAVGGLAGILGGTAHASPSDIRGLGSFRNYLVEMFKPVEDKIGETNKKGEEAYWSHIYIFSGYIDGNLVFVWADGYPSQPPTAKMVVSKHHKYGRKSYTLLWEYILNDRGVKGNVLGPFDEILHRDFQGNEAVWARISSGNHFQIVKEDLNSGKPLGKLVFDPRDARLNANGVYEGRHIGQVAREVYERRVKSNQLYQKNLPEVIARLEKLGRIKVT